MFPLAALLAAAVLGISTTNALQPDASLSWLPAHAQLDTRVPPSPPPPPLTSRPWMDATLPPDKRVELLLAVMTVEEKVAQLGYGGCPDNNETVRRNPHGIGGCGVVGPPPVGPPPPPGVPAVGGAYNTNELNRLLNTSTRLGIPASILGETTHSGGSSGTTVFPMPCTCPLNIPVLLLIILHASDAETCCAEQARKGLRGTSPSWRRSAASTHCSCARRVATKPCHPYCRSART